MSEESRDSNEEMEEVEEAAEEEAVEERVYTIPLSRAFIVPRKERASKAIRIIRDFICRHMKAESIRISNEVNELIWKRGIEKPPRKLRVVAVKDKEGTVTVKLIEG